MVEGGLSTIRPEIQGFISRENRSHADPWLQQVRWVEAERTLTLYVRRPAAALPQRKEAGPGSMTWEKDELLGSLTRPSLLNIFFPASLDEKPFCFCEDDVLVPATEAANKRLKPLSCNSVLAVVTTALQCVKREFPSTIYTSQPGSVRAQLAAEAVLAAIKEDPLGVDLVLALLSMAVSSYRRDTVSTPFPKQLELDGMKRAYPAFVSCLEDIPTMLEMSKWSDAGRVLSQLPPVAVVALHFVLVYLPAKLRSAGNGGGSACRGNGTPAAAAPVAAGSGDEEGTGSTATPLPPAAAPGKDGGLRADSSGLGAAGGAAAAAAAGSRGGGGGGGGGVGLGVGAGGGVSQLGDVPSHVFDVVLPSDPAFDAEAERGGSKVAYHGSSPENFHSILNTGLKVMSGSRLMKNGAAFGEGIYLSGSRKAAATFACRGDGSGTTVWPRSAFGNKATATGAAAAAANATANTTTATAAPTAARHQKFRHRLVAKCRVLNGDGAKEIEGWGDEASYFVVSDQSRVRVEALLLFHEGQASDPLTAGGAAAAAAPSDGAAERTLVSGSSRVEVTDAGKAGEKGGARAGMVDSRADGGVGEAGRVRNRHGRGDSASCRSASAAFVVMAAVGIAALKLAELAEWNIR